MHACNTKNAEEHGEVQISEIDVGIHALEPFNIWRISRENGPIGSCLARRHLVIPEVCLVDRTLLKIVIRDDEPCSSVVT